VPNATYVITSHVPEHIGPLLRALTHPQLSTAQHSTCVRRYDLILYELNTRGRNHDRLCQTLRTLVTTQSVHGHPESGYSPRDHELKTCRQKEERQTTTPEEEAASGPYGVDLAGPVTLRIYLIAHPPPEELGQEHATFMALLHFRVQVAGYWDHWVIFVKPAEERRTNKKTPFSHRPSMSVQTGQTQKQAPPANVTCGSPGKTDCFPKFKSSFRPIPPRRIVCR
jgi:hypothetical protein